MLWVVLDGVEENLPVQSRQRSLYCVYIQSVSYSLCDYIFSLAGLGRGLILKKKALERYEMFKQMWKNQRMKNEREG